MPITENLSLPTFDELDVQDVNISHPVMVSCGTYFGQYCDAQSKEYMLCKLEEKDPRKCLNEGKAVTMCGHEFFRKVRDTCKEEVEALAKCTEFTNAETKFYFCKKERARMDNCFADKMGMKRAPFGFFSQLRLHETDRPRPESSVFEFKQENVGHHDGGFQEKIKGIKRNEEYGGKL